MQTIFFFLLQPTEWRWHSLIRGHLMTSYTFPSLIISFIFPWLDNVLPRLSLWHFFPRSHQVHVPFLALTIKYVFQMLSPIVHFPALDRQLVAFFRPCQSRSQSLSYPCPAKPERLDKGNAVSNAYFPALVTRSSYPRVGRMFIRVFRVYLDIYSIFP